MSIARRRPLRPGRRHERPALADPADRVACTYRGHGHAPGTVVRGGTHAGDNGVDELLHQLHAMAQQQVVLPGALLHAHQQLVVFSDKRLHQRPVVGRQLRDQHGKGRAFRQGEQPDQMALTLFALLAGGGDDAGLRVHAGDVVRQGGHAPMHHQVLLLVEQRQHFAVLLELFAERLDQIGQKFFHAGEWGLNCRSNSLARPTPPITAEPRFTGAAPARML